MPFAILKSFLTQMGAGHTLSQKGGASGKKMMKETAWTYALIVSLVALFIKALIVQWAYNKVVPKMSRDTQELEYVDALALVILVNSLL